MRKVFTFGGMTLFGLFVLFLMVTQLFGEDVFANIVRDRPPDRADACAISQKFVTQNLKAPATAEFPANTVDNCQAMLSAGTWKVYSFVDAQNSYGALLRSDYRVEMRHIATTDTWTLVDLQIDAP